MALENEGASGLTDLGISPMPVGTLEEIRNLGLDPAKVATCAMPIPGQVRGCVWATKECQFHRKDLGAFKFTHGPLTVGYYLKTDEGDQKEDTCVCHAFIRSGLQARMRAGIRRRMEGDNTAEIVRIVALEPGVPSWKGRTTTTEHVWVPVKGVNPDDTHGKGQYKRQVTYEKPVPKFPRPGQLPETEGKGDDYQTFLMKQELDRRKAEDVALDNAFMAATEADMETVSDEEAAAFTGPVDLEIGTALGNAIATAEPVSTKKGAKP